MTAAGLDKFFWLYIMGGLADSPSNRDCSELAAQHNSNQRHALGAVMAVWMKPFLRSLSVGARKEKKNLVIVESPAKAKDDQQVPRVPRF